MKLLLLAGTSQARALAERLARDRRVEVIASFAGATRTPDPLPVPTRIGGFGSREAQQKYMNENGIGAVLDATHPFAARISARTHAICEGAGLPCLHLVRPGWRAPAGGGWTRVANASAAAAAIAPGATVFLATGRQSLAAFAHRHDVTLYLRQIDPPDAPFAHPKGGYVIGKPPFSVAAERSLFRRLGIDVLVAKDSGGQAGAKLTAASEIGLPVIMIDRPPQPPGETVASVDEALAWVERLLT